MTLALRKAWAFFVRDLRTDLSYKVSFALEWVDIALGVAAYFFFSRLLTGRQPDGYEPFAFILVGIAVNGAMTAGLSAHAQGIESEQSAGTLKTVLATRTSAYSVMFFSSVYPIARASLDSGLYVLGGVAFGLSFASVNVGASLALFGLAVLAFSSVGVFSAAFTLVLKHGDPLVWMFGALSWVFGGVFFPVGMLPPLLQNVSGLLPITHALNGLRATLLEGASLVDVGRRAGRLRARRVSAGGPLVRFGCTARAYGGDVGPVLKTSRDQGSIFRRASNRSQLDGVRARGASREANWYAG